MEKSSIIPSVMELIDPKTEIGKKLVNARSKRRFRNNFSQLMYREAIDSYDYYLILVSKLVKEIAIKDNSLSASIITKELIKSGILSIRDYFTQTDDYKLLFDIPAALGIDIINGFGCCRNNADLHHRILKNLDYFDVEFPCTLIEKGLNLSQKMEVEGNHVANLVQYRENLYVCDCYNGITFKFQDAITLDPYITNKEFENKELIYKPTDDIEFFGQYPEDINKKLHGFDEASRKISISKEELDEIIKESNYRFTNNRSMIEDFAHSTKPKKLEIVSLVK